MKAKNILIFLKVFIVSIVFLCFLANCAAVRTAGRVYKGVGDALVTSADEEEAKRTKKKSSTVSNASSGKKEKTEPKKGTDTKPLAPM